MPGAGSTPAPPVPLARGINLLLGATMKQGINYNAIDDKGNLSITIVNPTDVWHDGTGYVHLIRYIEGAYAVYTLRDNITEALDIFADYSRDALPGLTPDDDYIDELIAEAVKDKRDDPDDYVNDFYIRAGNDGAWLSMPGAIDTVRAGDCNISTVAIVPKAYL